MSSLSFEEVVNVGDVHLLPAPWAGDESDIEAIVINRARGNDSFGAEFAEFGINTDTSAIVPGFLWEETCRLVFWLERSTEGDVTNIAVA